MHLFIEITEKHLHNPMSCHRIRTSIYWIIFISLSACTIGVHENTIITESNNSENNNNSESPQSSSTLTPNVTITPNSINDP